MPTAILAARCANLADGTGALQISAVTKSGNIQRIISTVALAGTLTVTGFVDQAGVTKSLVIPIGFVGTLELGTPFTGGFTAQKSSASDNGKVVITWVENN